VVDPSAHYKYKKQKYSLDLGWPSFSQLGPPWSEQILSSSPEDPFERLNLKIKNIQHSKNQSELEAFPKKRGISGFEPPSSQNGKIKN